MLTLAGALVGMTSLVGPKVVPVTAPATEFSAEWVMKHVSAISQAPHPEGSEEIKNVQAYLIAKLRAMGLSPDLYFLPYFLLIHQAEAQIHLIFPLLKT